MSVAAGLLVTQVIMKLETGDLLVIQAIMNLSAEDSHVIIVIVNQSAGDLLSKVVSQQQNWLTRMMQKGMMRITNKENSIDFSTNKNEKIGILGVIRNILKYIKLQMYIGDYVKGKRFFFNPLKDGTLEPFSRPASALIQNDSFKKLNSNICWTRNHN